MFLRKDKRIKLAEIFFYKTYVIVKKAASIGQNHFL